MASYDKYLMVENAISDSLFLGDAFIKEIESKAIRNVTIIGDSITEGSDICFRESSFASMIQKKLYEKFGISQIKFNNLGIGGTTLRDFLNDAYKPSKPWNKANESWKACVKNTNPDLFIVAFGINASSEYDMKDYLNQLEQLRSSVTAPTLLINNLIFGNTGIDEPKNEYAKAIAKTQYYYAKSAKRTVGKAPLGCINANRVFTIMMNGRDEYSYEKYRQTMWYGSNEKDWVSNGGLTRYGLPENYIKVNTDSKVDTTLKNKITTQNSTFEALIDFNDVAGDGSIIFTARENTFFNHVNGIMIKVTIRNKKELRIITMNATGKFYEDEIGVGVKEGTATIVPLSQKQINDKQFRLTMTMDDEKIILRLEKEIVYLATAPETVYKGTPYLQCENLKGLKIMSPMYGYALYKQADGAVAGRDVLYGNPTGQNPNGGNGVNHPADIAFDFVYTRAINSLIDRIK